MQNTEAAQAEAPTIERWPPARYANRTRAIFKLCEAWFDGMIELDDFYKDEQDIEGFSAGKRIECQCEDDIFGHVEANNLRDEFEYVASLANAITWANISLQEDGFSDEASAFLRAIYFGREWAEHADDFDGLPPVLVHSR